MAVTQWLEKRFGNGVSCVAVDELVNEACTMGRKGQAFICL
jgi:hypothetical protein